MKNYTYNIVSLNIITSNVRRYFSIIVFGLLYFFLLFILPDISNLGEYDSSNHYSTVRIAYIVYAAIMPIIVSLSCFTYLHKKESCIYHHSLPYTRSQLFFSNFIVGLILINIPTLLFTGYVSLILDLRQAVSLYAFVFISSFFIYSICILAAIVAGTMLMHIILCVWFNIFVYTVVFVIMIYASAMLSGFNYYDYNLAFLSPIASNFAIKSIDTIIYLAISIIIMATSYILYKSLKLERCENQITFKSIGFILNIIIAIYASAMMVGIFFVVSKITMIIFAFIGGILGATIGYMVINKTVKIMNKDFIKCCFVSVLISMLLLISFMFDLFGYEKNIPKVSEVESVTITNIDFDKTSKSVFDNSLTLTSRDVISNVIKWQENLVDEQDNLHYTYTEHFSIKYKLKKGANIERTYLINGYNYDELKYIYESKGYKENIKIPNKNAFVVNINNEKYNIENADSNKIKKLINCINEDLKNRKIEDLLNTNDVFYIDIWYDKNDTHINFTVKETDENTIKNIYDNIISEMENN